MFAILGFIVAVVVLFKITIGIGFLSIFTLGSTGWDGAENKILTRILTCVGIVLVVFAWYLLYKNSPFTFNINLNV
jgi:hypothetical protein